MENTIKRIVSGALQIVANTPQPIGTPSPDEVTFVLKTMESLAHGRPGLKDYDYEFKDMSAEQDGSVMVHILTAEYNAKPWHVCSVHADLSLAIVKFTAMVLTPTMAKTAHEAATSDFNGFTGESEIEHRTEFAA